MYFVFGLNFDLVYALCTIHLRGILYCGVQRMSCDASVVIIKDNFLKR